MFYATELLSLRSNGKFAKIWLAATLGKAFRRKFKSATISMIDICRTCEDIEEIIISRSSRVMDRFSLILSSQLTFGCVKVLEIQTEILMRELFALQLYVKPRATLDKLGIPERDGLSYLDVPPVPPSVHTLANIVPYAESIMLREDIRDDRLSLMMRAADELSFGALTSAEVEQFLFPEERTSQEKLSAVPAEKIVALVPTGLPGIESPSADLTTSMVAVPDEIPGPFVPTRVPFEPPPADVAVMPLQEGLPRTPSKRPPPTAPEVETPTKRRRPLEMIQVPPVIPPAAVVEPPVPFDSELELESLGSSAFVIKKKKQRRLIVDDVIEISNTELMRRIKDLYIETKQFYHIRKYLPSGSELLTVPSTDNRWDVSKIPCNRGKRTWASQLCTQYDMPILQPIVPPIPVRVRRISIPSGHRTSRDIVRKSDATGEQTAEISEGMVRPVMTTDESGEKSKSMEQISNARVQITSAPIHTEEPTEQPEFGLPEIGRESIEQLAEPEVDIETLRQNIREELVTTGLMENGEEEFLPPALEREEITSGVTISPVRTTPRLRKWSKADLLNMIKDIWQERYTVAFQEICPPGSNTKLNAADCFQLCLELHAEQKVHLDQGIAYGKVFINKPDVSSSSSSNGYESR